MYYAVYKETKRGNRKSVEEILQVVDEESAKLLAETLNDSRSVMVRRFEGDKIKFYSASVDNLNLNI